MAIDTTSARSRRALLMGAVGGAAAAAAATVARASPVAAADGDDLKLGQDNTASTLTTILTEIEHGGGLVVTTGDGSRGILGAGGAIGVEGAASEGVGVLANSGTGYGLRVRAGRIKVDEVSGVAIIRKGKKSVTVKPGVDINEKTFVLLTPMTNLGSRALWFTKSGAKDQFAIRMSATRGGPTKIAWLALERG